MSEREPKKDSYGKTLIAYVATIFLTASRCPVGCTMCDLHRNTLAVATPPGAIPTQIQYAKQRLPTSDWIKLYNSGNFFDPSSIPRSDHAKISALCAGYGRVIIENHPRFGRSRHAEFRDLIEGRLEIAVGLETVQPRVLDRLGKQMSRDDFDQYANELHSLGIDLRVFLIVGTPGISTAESIRWARLSLRHAIRSGARHVSLIPARAGHGWNGKADTLPVITLQQLADLFVAALDDIDGAACLSVDLWDIRSDRLCDAELHLLERFESAILCQDASELSTTT